MSYNQGTENPNAVLTDRVVRYVRRLRARGVSLGKIALEVGVSKAAVQQICDGTTWRRKR